MAASTKMSQYPTLCMVSYDTEEIAIPKRSSRTPRRVNSAGVKSREARQEAATNYGYLSVREDIKVVTDEYTTPHRLSLNSSPKLPGTPNNRHQTQLTNSLTSPRYDLGIRARAEGVSQHHKRSYSDEFRLPVLRCGGAGETSLTVNAELLQDPKWNDYISAWVSGKKDGYRAYLNIARAMSLIDRGLIHYLPDFEDLPPLPCPRFWKHMHKEKLPQVVVEKPKKKIIKKPEFWSWKGRTTTQTIPSLKLPPPTKPAPIKTVVEEPEPEKVLPEIDREPSDYGSLQSDYLTDIQRSFVSATSSSGWSTPFDDIFSDESRVSIKEPPNLFQLTTPPKTATTAKWEEHSFLSDSAIDSWADRDALSPLEPLDDDMNLFLTSEYIEVLEPVEWGCTDIIYAKYQKKLKEIITNPGLEVEVVPPLALEPEPFQPDKIEDVDRVVIYNADSVEVMERPEIPEPPPPPKEPTPPPPKVPTPPPPKPKRRPLIKKAKKPAPTKSKPLSPLLEPEPAKEPTPEPQPPPLVEKVPTPVPPSPVKIPSPLPPPEPPPPPREPSPPPPKDPTPEPEPREATPQFLLTEASPQASKTPTPEISEPGNLQPPMKAPLPMPEKDLEFLAELEREKLADERRVKAFSMFEKLRRRLSFPKVKMDEIISVKEYGWLPQFCIVNEGYKKMYKAIFDTVDDNKDGYLNCFETLLAMKGIAGLQKMTQKEEEYVYRVLEIADYNIAFGTDFRLFAIIAALAQKIASVDDWVKNLIKKTDLDMLEWKMFKAKELFQWCLDEDTNQLSVRKLMIELKAGGVSQEHQDEVEEKFGRDGNLDLLTFLTYLPLFIMTHNSVVENPLDDSREK